MTDIVAIESFSKHDLHHRCSTDFQLVSILAKTIQATNIPIYPAKKFPVAIVPLGQVVSCNENFPAHSGLAVTLLGIRQCLAEHGSFFFPGIIGLNRY